MKLLFAFFLVLLLLSTPALAADDVDELHARAEKGDKTAVAGLRTEASAGNAKAQVFLGRLETCMVLCNHCCPGPFDPKDAFYWFNKAAEQGNAEAQIGIGGMYGSGLYSSYGIEHSYAEAAKWYRKAAEQGNEEAAFALGRLYLTGDGVPKDLAEAYFWISVSDPVALAKPATILAHARDSAAKGLTPEQTATVDKRIEEWRHAHPRPDTRPVTP